MGIRFACHACGKHLNIKNELAGRRGICPSCSGRFRIPMQDAEKSTPVEEPKAVSTAAGNSGASAQQSMAVSGSARVGNAGPGASPENESPAPQVSSLDILTSDPTSTWYVRPPNGGQYGPATGEILRQWIAEGRVATTALMWRDGWPQWREASEALPELAGRLPNPNGQAVTDQNGNAANGRSGVVAANNAVTLNSQTATSIAGSAQSPSKKSRDAHQRASAVGSPAHSDRAVADAPMAADGSAFPGSRNNNATSKNSAAIAARERSEIAGDEFGYEDSVFAKNGSSYASSSAQTPALHGRGDVGQIRRKRATRRTTMIVLLGVFSMVLIAALIYVTTR